MNETNELTRSRRQWEAVAKLRVFQGESGSAVEADFVRKGLDVQSAKAILDDAVEKVRSRATALLVGSIFVMGLGILVTLVSYSAARSSYSGGTYWIWYGPVIGGGILAVVALRRLLRARR
jgi:hypothetical protein